MRMRTISVCVLFFLFPAAMQAAMQQPGDSLVELTDAYLDTVRIEKAKEINDYMTIGVNYGVQYSSMYFNPESDQEWMFQPTYVSILFTRYCKMFDYMPYFGIEAGISYGKQGFRLKQDEDAEYPNIIQVGSIGSVTNLLEESISVVKIPFRTVMHYDIYPVRIKANVGFYGGWRTEISRTAYRKPASPEVLNTFLDNEPRFDYGMEGGVGLAFLHDPVELHVGALLGWSWSSIYEPDSRPVETNKYYYRYANPLDLMISVGIHFQLTKRTGKTNSQLKKEAYRTVYGDN